MPPFSREALQLLRDPSQFRWYSVTFIGLVFYVYSVEIERRNWSTVLAGLGFWAMDWINEIVNALVLHFTGYAAVWTTTGATSFQILVGLNFEIAALFAVTGVIFTKQLPARAVRIFGVPNRWLFVLGYSCLSVFIELLLHRTGYFHWAYRWWNVPHVELIVIFGYGTFYAVAAWVHDLETLRQKLAVVGTLTAIVIGGLTVFGAVLHWL